MSQCRWFLLNLCTFSQFSGFFAFFLRFPVVQHGYLGAKLLRCHYIGHTYLPHPRCWLLARHSLLATPTPPPAPSPPPVHHLTIQPSITSIPPTDTLPNEYQPYGWVIIPMAMGECSAIAACPSEGRRLSRPRHCSKCAAGAQSCVSQWFSWKHKLLSTAWFEPGSSRAAGKRVTTRPMRPAKH